MCNRLCETQWLQLHALGMLLFCNYIGSVQSSLGCQRTILDINQLDAAEY